MLPSLLRKGNIRGGGAAAQQTQRKDAVWMEWASYVKVMQKQQISCRALSGCREEGARGSSTRGGFGGCWGSAPVAKTQSTSAVTFWEWLRRTEENLEEINESEKKEWLVRLRRISNIATHSALWLFGGLFFLTDTLQKHWKNLPRIAWNHFQNEPKKKTLPGTAYKC